MTCGLLICVFVIAVALITILIFKKPEVVTNGLQFCRNEDCQSHAAILTQSLTTSIDPCENFSAFVCSAWTAPKEFAEFSKSTLSHLLVSWSNSVMAMLRNSSQLFEVDSVVVAAFNTCMSEDVDQASGLRALRFFMAHLSLSWPEKSPDGTEPLDVLLDLSINWQLSLWFQTSLIGGPQRKILITPGSYVLYWVKHHEHVSSYDTYYYQYFNKFNFENATAPNESTIKAVSDNQIDILRTILSATARKRSTPALFHLKNISTYTKAITLSDWIRALNNNLRPSPPITPSDLVLVANTALLTAADAIFSKYDKDTILEHISWWFVQMNAPLADRKLLETQFGSIRDAEVHKPNYCTREVEAMYKLLLVSMYVRSYITVEERLEINARLNNIKRVMVTKVEGTPMLDNISEGLIKEKIEKLDVLLWPKDKFLTEEGLTALYKNFSGEKGNFLSFWINSREQTRKMVNLPDYREILRIPVNYAQPYFKYVYPLNLVSISVGAISRPVYYKNGTNSMFYGGLGFLFALEAVKAFNSEGIELDTSGNPKEWLPKATRDALTKKYNCLGSQEEDVFPEIPALEVSFSALQEALKKDPTKNVRILSQYTEEQAFFLTVCYMTCSVTGTPTAFLADCNKAVMNVPAFSKAFNCSEASKMHPKNKCLFFE